MISFLLDENLTIIVQVFGIVQLDKRTHNLFEQQNLTKRGYAQVLKALSGDDQ
jgi:hypothetical protein